MSRKLRIEYPGAMYHVMNRGDQREDIFRDDQDRQKFLTTLGEACVKTEWQAGQEIERLGWDEDQLRAHRKGHPSKVKLARRLRQETTMSLKWIAARLQIVRTDTCTTTCTCTCTCTAPLWHGPQK